MLGISWTLYTIAGLIVAARVYTQVKIIRQFGIGDMVMIGAMVCPLQISNLLCVSKIKTVRKENNRADIPTFQRPSSSASTT